MSYDLFFRPPAGQPMPSSEQLTSWFASRANYSVGAVQAIYENEDTQVYFAFDLPSATDGDAAPSVVFNLNYARHGGFALEAASELEALVQRFSFEVEDLQIGGLTEGAYDTEGFLRGWQLGNDHAMRVLLPKLDAASARHTLPAAELQRIWRWNRARRDLQARLGDDVFVPVINFIELDGRVQSAAVWVDAIPEALPPTDVLLLRREQLAPRRFLRRVADVCVCPSAAAAPLLGRFAAPGDGYQRMTYRDPPAEVSDFFRARSPWRGALPMLPGDGVLEAELIARARAAGA